MKPIFINMHTKPIKGDVLFRINSHKGLVFTEVWARSKREASKISARRLEFEEMMIPERMK